MTWNWQLPDWPQFTYEKESIRAQEKAFLLSAGKAIGCLKGIGESERNQFIVEILSLEGAESSKIEGEVLDRASLQSSIRKHFGIDGDRAKKGEKESRMAKLLCDVYRSFNEPLTNKMVCRWHAELFDGHSKLENVGEYRTHADPMQIVSNRLGSPKVFFEAPPSEKVQEEMDRFIDWFNSTLKTESVLGRAALAHVYFESIHPFEDGNGRIGRALVEKILSQAIGHPALIAVSKVLESKKSEYYKALERCNRTLEVDPWVEFFANAVLTAQNESIQLLEFLIKKARFLTKLSGQINERQETALLRMFAEGPSGFKGGLSAEKYISIAKTSRATATRDLTDLVEKGALTKTGELRHTRYHLNL
ncbi:MAG: Fic family protein [Verrucomicrobia bacterium]|nr:Fic family protein [Verrucomicrobiota bacterium]